jgi:uncharacterized protein (DUF1786 family)
MDGKIHGVFEHPQASSPTKIEKHVKKLSEGIITHEEFLRMGPWGMGMMQ